jgi:hypothetical protein
VAAGDRGFLRAVIANVNASGASTAAGATQSTDLMTAAPTTDFMLRNAIGHLFG